MFYMSYFLPPHSSIYNCSNIPDKFRPKFLTPVSVGIINSASGGAAHIETNGNVVWRGARTSSALYINAVYLAK